MTTETDFDLQPHPRILPMLGEITLAPWKCVAELIDNSIDGFLSAIRREGSAEAPEVHVQVPMTDDPQARLSVIDNGPGMSPETLELAVKAGWSGNDPISSLGMFGMGFNIATARLGTVTTVWTTRAGDHEWVGLTIDFDQLRSQRHFRTPRRSEPKADPAQHGTKVIVEKLKIEQRQWFAKAGNRTKLSNEVARTYSAMLRTNGVPMSFRLTINGRPLEGRRHCVWSGPGNPARVVQTSKFGQVDAFQSFDVRLDPRPFCQSCWQWLPANEGVCPSCSRGDGVVNRQRAVKGWLGVQRFLSETAYGIDFVRHGRKIEMGNKELFSWWDQDREKEEKEYPIDDPRDRGRIVGEIHLDHCRVSYTKDRFDRNDPAWEDMIRIVRGEGPLRPDKAAELAVGPNDSALFKLFQVFRRSSPKPKVAGAWRKILVVPNNEVAEELARKYDAGEPAHQTDEKWLELVEEEDRRLLLTRTGGPATPGAAPPPGPTDTLEGFEPAPAPPAASVPAPAAPPLPIMTPIASLSRQYVSEATEQRWNVSAFQTDESHPDVGLSRPWRLLARPQGGHDFLVNPAHAVFASATLTPLDGLLAELAWSAMDFLHDDPGDATFGGVLADLRLKYASSVALDYASLSNEAKQTLAAVSTTLARNIEPSDAPVLFKELSPDDQKAILQKMATRGAGSPQGIIAAGRFLEYAPSHVVAGFFARHPELFLDGRCWDDPYATLDYELPEATEVARSRVLRHYESLLSDAVWLAEQDPVDLAQANRARVLRALYALDLLAPSTEEEAE